MKSLKTIILALCTLFIRSDSISDRVIKEYLKERFPVTSEILSDPNPKIKIFSDFQQYLTVNLRKRQIIRNAKRSQFFLFGDLHSGKLDNEYLISLLPDLKKAGYENLAVEIDYEDQGEIDYYLYVHKDFKRLQENLNYDISPYIDVIDAANELGFNIWCFDHRPIVRMSIRKQGEFSKFGTDRSRKMYDNIVRYLNLEKIVKKENGGVSISTRTRKRNLKDKTKFIVFTGAIHANEKPTLDPQTRKIEDALGYYLTKGGFKTYSLSLSDYSPFTDNIDEIFPVYYIEEKE